MVTYHPEVDQGSPEWLAMRCGLLTASQVKLILTPALKTANKKKTRSHLYDLLAQRITQYVEPSYLSDDMLRGMSDEVDARILYDAQVALVTSCGFITNDRWGFTIGYSPDGLVGDDGLIEVKSRRQEFQVETILQAASDGMPPADYMLQLQTGLLVSERQWIDFISYCGGMPMMVLRVYPDARIQSAIVEAATEFHELLDIEERNYRAGLSGLRTFPTERKKELEMTL
jgi:hypothetical protein